MNIIKRYFHKRNLRKNNEEKVQLLALLGDTFRVMERFHDTGLLSFDRTTRRLFIEECLGVVMMPDRKKWENFLYGVFSWIIYKEQQEAWSTFMIAEENKAVRQAKRKSGQVLSAADIKRIKSARRDEIAFSDMEPPKVEPIEFFVVRSNSKALAQSKDESDTTNSTGAQINGGDILLVGSYDGEHKEMDMAAWSEVERFLGK